MKKLLTLFFAFVASSTLLANNVITYTAREKLSGTTSTWSSGLHTNAFNVAIISHKFFNGKGTITLAGDVTTIGNYAFDDCSGLTSVTIPNSVTKIGDYAFRNCSALTSITIPNSVTSIGNYAFYKCSGLRSVTIPNSVTTIGDDAFGDCTSLTSVTIPNSVKTIGKYAFYKCGRLTSVTIPNSVTTIGYAAFYDCKAFKKTNYTGTVADWCKIEFGSSSNPIYYSHNFFINDVEVKDLVIPNSVTKIGYEAFKGCSGLTSITIPNSVKAIDNSAFSYCSGLTSVTIPNSVKTIGDDAFCGCSGLTSVTIPNSVTTIGGFAFHSCSGLTSITIPNSVKTIGDHAFYKCSSLTSITIPNSVTTIGRWAFEKCSGLTSVTILNPNVKIDKDAFKDCTITDLYCAASMDLSAMTGTIKNVHHLSEEELILLTPFSSYAQQYVESHINEWQKKGDFEKVADWQKRVNETTRKQKVNEYLKEAQQTYLSLYTTKQRTFTLGSYDAENEVYIVKESSIGNMLVSIPISDAPYVQQNWASCTKTPHYAFAGSEVVLQSIDFKFPNKKTYTYKSNQNLTYSQADIQYNFDPIELNLGSNTGVQQPKGQQTIQQKQLTIGKSDVDMNIPSTNIRNANTFVVIIANENYQSVAKVPFANNDGEIFSQYCNKTLGIPSENIHIYKDATYNNMRSALAWLVTVCKSYEGTASVIFYYTGHGIPDESDKTAYLLPIDGDGKYVQSAIALDEIYGKLGSMPTKSTTVLMDACFSGATRDGAMLAAAKGVAIKVKKGVPMGNTVALTAAQGDETAGFYEEQGHGLFTYFLLKKLQETKGDVTLEQLSSYITTEVKRRSAVQGKIQTPSIMAASAVADSWMNWKLK